MGLSDESLVAGMAAEDPDAAAAFVRRFQARVFGLAVSIVGSPELAEEVAQDAFFKAWRSAAAYDARRGRVSTWLLTITRNSAIDAIRLRRELPMEPDTLLALLAARETDQTSDDDQTSARLQQALQELPPEQAKPVVMMTFYGLTAAEIATRDDIPVGTVKTRIRRGLQALRQRMGARDV